MNSVLKIDLPNPYTNEADTVRGPDVDGLRLNMREHVTRLGLGASDVGSRFDVYRGENDIVGVMSYNGKFEHTMVDFDADSFMENRNY